MKSGQIVYIPNEELEGVAENKVIEGGRARLEELLYEYPDREIWLVYFLDDRYDYSIQRLFYKNNLPQSTTPTTSTKERIMAIRKTPKKSAKKKAAKKVAKKKVAKKVATKKKSEKKSLSKYVCELITERKYTDEQILSKMKGSYSSYAGLNLRTISYYRRYLNLGKMEKAGFSKPSKEYTEIGGAKKTERKTATRKKVACRKVK